MFINGDIDRLMLEFVFGFETLVMFYVDMGIAVRFMDECFAIKMGKYVLMDIMSTYEEIQWDTVSEME